MVPTTRKASRIYRKEDGILIDCRYVLKPAYYLIGRLALCKSPSEGATGLLIRSVKSNKELLLARVTEPGEYTGNPLRRGIARKMIIKEMNCLWEKQFLL